MIRNKQPMTKKRKGEKHDTPVRPNKGNIQGDTLKVLSEKERRFVLEYLVDFNGTQAAFRSGYKGTRPGAGVWACTLLKKAKVREAIKEVMSKFLDEREAILARVIDEYKAVAFSRLSDFVQWDDKGNLTFSPSDKVDDRSLVGLEKVPVICQKTGEVIDHSFKVRLQDKIRALEGLSRYLGIFQPDDPTPPEIHIHIDSQDSKL